MSARDLGGVVELLKREAQISNPIERLWTQEAVKYLERVAARKRASTSTQSDGEDPGLLRSCSVGNYAWSGFKEAGAILARQRVSYNNVLRLKTRVADLKRDVVSANNQAMQ